MRKNSFGQGLAILFVVAGILYAIGSIEAAREPKCIEAGCDNKQASGSCYCYLHKPYTGCSSGTSTSSSSSSYSGKSSSGSTSQSSTSSSGSSSSSYNSKSHTNDITSYSSDTKKGTTTKKSTYDDGYDDIYMDGDYDYDRYDRDSDYADGVDDAMDEDEEDW